MDSYENYQLTVFKQNIDKNTSVYDKYEIVIVFFLYFKIWLSNVGFSKQIKKIVC